MKIDCPTPLLRLIPAIVCLGAAACDRGEPASAGPALPAANARAAAELRAIAEAWEAAPFERASERPFRANRPSWIPELRERIAAASSPREEIELRHNLARELLFAGESVASQEEYGRVFDLAARWNLPEEAKERLLRGLRSEIAIAFLRQGEEENCLAHRDERSCIFPLSEGGVHQRTAGAGRAYEVLRASLAADPGDLGARWLLNLAAMALGRYPEGVPDAARIPPAAFASEHDLPRFRDVASARGVAVLGLAGGCAVDDFDGDGDLDIVASSWGLRDPIRFLVQVPGGRFVDRSERAGLAGEVGGLNLCHADYDGDGNLDLLVLRGGWLGKDGRHPDSLLRNRGDGTFENVTRSAGLDATDTPGQSAAWADFDLDGDLDLFVAGEDGGDGVFPCRLHRNRGDGTFEEIAAASGLARSGFVKGATWGDHDNDGDPDLYLSRAGEPNVLFRNEGEATSDGGWCFRDVTAEAGVAEPTYSFPAWFFDHDNDGDLDLFVGGFDGSPIGAAAGEYLGVPHPRGWPRLYRNRGDGAFDDVTRAARLDRAHLTMGANFGDLDNDGFPDLYLGNGAPDLRSLLPNRMFRNDGGERFQDVTTAGGFGHLQKGHGIAFADIDGDGDQDIYAVLGGWYTGDAFPNALFENPGTPGAHWVTLRLEGKTANRFGVGARVRVVVREGEETRTVHALGGTGGSFGAGSHQLEIGLGRADAIDRIEVDWPAGVREEVFTGGALDRALRLVEGTARAVPEESGGAR